MLQRPHCAAFLYKESDCTAWNVILYLLIRLIIRSYPSLHDGDNPGKRNVVGNYEQQVLFGPLSEILLTS